MGPLSMEQALADEAVAIGGLGVELADRLKQEASEQEAGQTSECKRTDKNADVRDGDHDSATQADSRRRKKFYRSLNELNRSALCLSGGGIRSATFCLGVIQALAAFDVKSGTVSRRPGTFRRSQKTLSSADFTIYRPFPGAAISARGSRRGGPMTISERFETN